MFKKKLFFSGLVLLILAISFVHSAPSFVYIRSITIDHTKVGTTNNTDQNYFPVLVSLSDATLKNISQGGHVQSINGYDIAFYSDINLITQLDHEIETYDGTNGSFIAWVKIPFLSHTIDTNFYVGYGANVVSSMENVNGVWDDNGSNYFKGVWHLHETGTGTTGEYVDSTINSVNGTLVGNSVLKADFNMTTSANSYIYEDLNSVSDYTIVSGDALEYDVYWTSSTDFIAVDFNTNTGGFLSASGAVDQNGLSASPTQDLSSKALNQWYHRIIQIPVGLVGTTINAYDIACENDTTSTKTAYLDNIVITNNATVNKKIYSSGDTFTHTTHKSSNGTISAFYISINPTPTISDGKIGYAINSTGTRYANVNSSPTTAVDNWTLEAWINPSVLPMNGFAVYNGNDSGGYGFGVGAATNANPGSKLQGLYGVVSWIDSGYTFPSANNWYSVTMVRSAGTVRFYVNGTQTANTNAATPNAPTAHFTIGNQLDPSNNPYRFFNGIIDEVRISNTARSPDWIKTKYTNQNSPGNIGAPSFYSVGDELLGPGYSYVCTFVGPDTNWQTCWPVYDANVKAEYQLIGENILHWHDLRYYTKSESDVNWAKYILIGGDINFSQLKNFPVACSGGEAIQDINGTHFSCVSVNGDSGVDTNWQTSWSLFDANLKATYPLRSDVNSWGDARYAPINSSSKILVKLTDQSNSNANLASVTDLEYTLEANKKYGFHCRIMANSNATSNGIRMAMLAPSGYTYFSYKVIGWTSVTAIVTTAFTVSDGTQNNTNSNGATRATYEIMGSINNVNAGTLVPRFRSELVANATVYAGSWCKYTPGV